LFPDEPLLALKINFTASAPDTEILPGKLLLNIINGVYDSVNQVKIIFETQFDVRVIYYKSISNADPKSLGKYNPSNDIFKRCEKPPYGLRLNNASILPAVRELVYGDYKFQQVFDWSGHVGDWSEKWDAGLEWWGCHAITSYSSQDNKFVVATASTTD